MKNELLLKVANQEIVPRPPVWVMRQAGRILPEYRRLREKVNGFKALVENPELVCEITLQPVNHLGVDAAILFSDILVVPEAMGLTYQMIESKGPWFEKTIEQISDIQRLHVVEEDELEYVLKGVKLIKSALQDEIPLIGFAGAPWTIFAYMIEGKGSKTFSKAKAFLYQHPNASKLLLEMITNSTIHYLKGQVKAGIDLIQIFDSWAGILSPDQYKEFSMPYIQQICDAIINVPKTVFAKGAFFALQDLSFISCNVIGLDWTVSSEYSKYMIQGRKSVQGNMDPCLLFADIKTIESETIKMINRFEKNHIVNLGHGVYPDTPLDGVKCFIDTVKNYTY